MASTELGRALDLWRAMWPQKEEPTVEDYRKAYEDFVAQFPVPGDVKAEKVDAGGVPAVWVSTPAADAERVILYLHGGGYVIGSAWGYREMTSHIGRAAHGRALVVDYRLAPEHAFPAAVDDAVAAYRWLLDQGNTAANVVVAGDSAGGGLTVATLVALRNQGVALPAAGVCLSPWVDLECTGDTMRSLADVDPVVAYDGVMGMAAMYLAGQDAKAPLASPLYANLTGLPPLLIQVGTAETLLDDSKRLAERARAAGVDCTLDIVEGAPHVWQVFSSFLPEGKEAIDRVGEFIRKHAG